MYVKTCSLFNQCFTDLNLLVMLMKILFLLLIISNHDTVIFMMLRYDITCWLEFTHAQCKLGWLVNFNLALHVINVFLKWQVFSFNIRSIKHAEKKLRNGSMKYECSSNYSCIKCVLFTLNGILLLKFSLFCLWNMNRLLCCVYINMVFGGFEQKEECLDMTLLFIACICFLVHK